MGSISTPANEVSSPLTGSDSDLSNVSNGSSTSSYDGRIMQYGDFPDSGVDVLIVGAGLAGLTAAIECVRKGHRVRVLERGAEINTMGT